MSTKVQALELAGLGYNPFRPDVGIFCGGFQGPLYPNPTALLLDELSSFNPIQFQDVIPIVYELNQYVGLGKGIPGIKIRNPGHFFGIMDTFFRMSYGLKILDTLRKAETDVSNPIIDIIIPLILLQTVGTSVERVGTEFNISELYPKLTEIPSDYIASFDVDNPIHTPVSNLDDTMFDILKDVTFKEGYINLVETLRTALQDLQVEAQKFETRKHYFLTSASSIVGRDPLWHPLSQFETFTLAGSSPQFITSAIANRVGTYLSEHTSLSVNTAIKQINQDGEFHGEVDPQVGLLDYRSVTELNGVINLLPVQIHARSDHFVGPLVDIFAADTVSSLARFWVIMSLNLNITAQTESSVTITGKMNLDVNNHNITMWAASRDTAVISQTNECVAGSFQSILIGNEGRAFIKHKIITNIKVTNDFTWDKVWFGLPDTTFEASDEKLAESQKLETFFTRIIGLQVLEGEFRCPDSRPLPDDLWASNPQVTELTFDETIPLKVGCNNIMGEFIAGSIHFHSSNARSQQDIPDIIVPPDPNKPLQMKYEIINAELLVKDSQGNTIVEIDPFSFETSFFTADDSNGDPLGDA